MFHYDIRNLKTKSYCGWIAFRRTCESLVGL